jgi:uncharacterized protein YecE (DUF72 family)
LKTIKIGCCGFPVSRKKYFTEYRLVELQNTFYNLPSIEWAMKIRGEAPEGFEFTVKAWQVITHPPKSPTWRKLREKPPGSIENYGWLKPTRENLEALKRVVEVSERLGSRIIILQTPATLPFSEESIEWINEFFDEARNIIGDIMLGWEPRGVWADQYDVLKSILGKHGVIHVVDPYRRLPVSIPSGIVYFRLHGIGRGEVNYRYKYGLGDFRKLLEIIDKLEFREAYVLFNNVYMYNDSREFRKYLLENTGGRYRII